MDNGPARGPLRRRRRRRLLAAVTVVAVAGAGPGFRVPPRVCFAPSKADPYTRKSGPNRRKTYPKTQSLRQRHRPCSAATGCSTGPGLLSGHLPGRMHANIQGRERAALNKGPSQSPFRTGPCLFQGHLPGNAVDCPASFKGSPERPSSATVLCDCPGNEAQSKRR